MIDYSQRALININIYQGNSTEVLASNESGIFQY